MRKLDATAGIDLWGRLIEHSLCRTLIWHFRMNIQCLNVGKFTVYMTILLILVLDIELRVALDDTINFAERRQVRRGGTAAG